MPNAVTQWTQPSACAAVGVGPEDVGSGVVPLRALRPVDRVTWPGTTRLVGQRLARVGSLVLKVDRRGRASKKHVHLNADCSAIVWTPSKKSNNQCACARASVPSLTRHACPAVKCTRLWRRVDAV